MNRRSNSKRFDVSQLPVGIKGFAFGRRRAAEMKDSNQIGLDRVESKPCRIGNGSIVRAAGSIGVRLPARHLDLVVFAHDPHAHGVAAAVTDGLARARQ